jgi:hypothetical protein
MATVAKLIKQLQDNHNPYESVIFQYVVAEHTKLDEDEFSKVADYLMDNDNFAEDTTDLFKGWITEAEDVIYESEKENA